MVRARGVARKSFARRRVRRVKKYNAHVVPLRFKKYLPKMADLIEPELKDSVGLEPFIDAELTLKGVPTSEFPYYYGFAKRMLALYRDFTGETLQIEKTNLIEEYVLRGYNREVLEQGQDVVDSYASETPIKPTWNYDDVVGKIWLPEPKGVYGGNYDDHKRIQILPPEYIHGGYYDNRQ